MTGDEIRDLHALAIQCLNGTLMQDGHTSRLIFGVPRLIVFLSRFFTLVPGDVILTGTPKGAGAFRNPPVFLKDRDEVIVEIEGRGCLVNTCQCAAL